MKDLEPYAPEPDDAVILGIDNVRVDLPIAGLGSRMLAAALDTVLLVVVVMIWAVAMIALGGLFDGLSGLMIAILLLGVFAINWGYYIVFETALEGQTPGKKALKLRTVSHLGGRASTAAIVQRNLIRPIDYLVGVLAIFLDPRARRLGDRLAGTLVIHQRVPRSIREVGRVPEGWGPAEIGVVESFLDRAGRMEVERARLLAGRLLAGLRRRDPGFFELGNGSVPSSDPVFELMRVLQVRYSEHERRLDL